MSRWRKCLLQGEIICWEGRPAPRAFTFRNWRWSAVGVILCLSAVALEFVLSRAGNSLVSAAGPVVVAALGLLFFWVAVGHLLIARLAWEMEFYALTDRRLLVESGLFRRTCSDLPLPELDTVSRHSLGVSLATVMVRRRDGGRPITLLCLEHPELLLDKLPGAEGTMPGQNSRIQAMEKI